MQAILVLNASFEPLQTVSLKHAIKMIIREIAVVYQKDGDKKYGPFDMPKVVRLVKYVKQSWQFTRAARFSRTGVLNRDNRICCFCGNHAVTVDHVMPSSRGGQSTWENCVSSCQKCNNKKDSRTPKEAGMRMLYQPHVPNLSVSLGNRFSVLMAEMEES